MLKESQIYKYWDIVYSCFVPHEMLSEYRMPVHVLIYVYSGEMQVDDDGHIWKVSAGNYVFLKRDHQVKLLKQMAEDKPYKAISIRFERSFLRDFFSQLDKSALPTKAKRIREAAVLLPQVPSLKSLFLSLFPYTDANVKPKDEIIRLKMQEALYCLLEIDERFYPTLFDFNEAWKIDLLPFMEANYTQDMTLEEFATYTGRSLATFKRDFAKVSDLSPEKWLIGKRLDKAYELLSHGNVKPSDVYIKVGFKNRSHFSSVFKRKFGISPGGVAVNSFPINSLISAT